MFITLALITGDASLANSPSVTLLICSNGSFDCYTSCSSGQVLVNAAKQSSAASTSTARPKVNTAVIRLNLNDKSSYFKPHSPKRRHFNQKSAANTNIFSRNINTAKGKNVTTTGPKAVVNAAEGKKETVVKILAGESTTSFKYKGMVDIGCSRHMTGNKALLTDYQDIDGGFVAFGGSTKGGTKFNLFFVSQMCDKKNNVLFTESECLVLSPDFKLVDESQVPLRVPRQNNMYNFDLKNVVPSRDLTCLFAKATIDESNL
nr:ribonuclease H-like domain-containing protein [Tanacetum cinerariifolium]